MISLSQRPIVLNQAIDSSNNTYCSIKKYKITAHSQEQYLSNYHRSLEQSAEQLKKLYPFKDKLTLMQMIEDCDHSLNLVEELLQKEKSDLEKQQQQPKNQFANEEQIKERKIVKIVQNQNILLKSQQHQQQQQQQDNTLQEEQVNNKQINEEEKRNQFGISSSQNNNTCSLDIQNISQLTLDRMKQATSMQEYNSIIFQALSYVEDQLKLKYAEQSNENAILKKAFRKQYVRNENLKKDNLQMQQKLIAQSDELHKIKEINYQLKLRIQQDESRDIEYLPPNYPSVF